MVRNTMSYSLGAAAAATGLNKTSILRAIKSGKVSGTKDALGQWWVEPAELHRVPKPAREHVRLVPDKIYPGMWRVVGPSGTLSDMVNKTRAQDVAWRLAESMVSTRTLAAWVAVAASAEDNTGPSRTSLAIRGRPPRERDFHCQ